MRILTLLLFCASLFATEYDNLLLRAQASMFPKILLLDKNIDEKTTNSTISLSIVYNESEAETATTIKELIDNKYNSKLGKYDFDVGLMNVDSFTESDSSSSYYLLGSSSEKKQKVITHAVDNKRICFSYSYKDFDYNTLISLFLKEKTYIYINKSAINNYNVKFVPIFYKIAKVK